MIYIRTVRQCDMLHNYSEQVAAEMYMLIRSSGVNGYGIINKKGWNSVSELANCVRCGDVFAKQTRNTCPDCYKEEEEAFDKVYRFLRDRKNREATLDEINRATGAEKDLIIKFRKERRLRTSVFQTLEY